MNRLGALSHSVISDSATPWTVAFQAPRSMGFSRQEYWSGLPLPLRAIFLTQGSNSCLWLASPALAGKFLATSTAWEIMNAL